MAECRRMNNNMLSAGPLEQPWWRVRPQLVATLTVLGMICIALWADTPLRKWITRQVVQAELPSVPLFAQADR
ncbi:hypothetical protein ACXR0O_12075 [Verrucomicrobiota bacterium sgz303538]